MANDLTALVVLLSIILDVFDVDSASISTKSLVLRHGYPIESHTVTTNDGYILKMHRIPYSSRVPAKGPSRPVVFIQHGLLCSSSDWVVLGVERGLAFLLSDAGYDVWLGNARGNTYSRRHVTLDPNSSKFWDFDWHEIGAIDLPTMTDYIRKTTKVKKIVYIGHSQGTTAFFVLNSIYPEYNQYFESAHLLSPVAYMSHLTAPLVKLAAPMLGSSIVYVPLDRLGYFEFNPSRKFIEILGSVICDKNRSNYVLCSNALFLAAGFDDDTIEPSIIDDVMELTPAGASTKQFLHYMQEYNSGKFRQFDYGRDKNLAKYRSAIPPNYPIGNIDVPIYLYYSESDSLVAIKDVEQLMDELKTVVKTYIVPDKKFDHLGQMYNPKIKTHVYDTLIDNILKGAATVRRDSVDKCL